MNVVLDTNVLISGIFFRGNPGKIVDLWADGKLNVFATPLILKEYLETLEEFTAKDVILTRHWKLALPELCHICPDTATHSHRICRDVHDDKFIWCAINSGAKYLISGDRDLISLPHKFPVEILTPGIFLKKLGL